MKLSDTSELMNSELYSDRFIAEYVQTKIRYEKLHRTIINIESGSQEPLKSDLGILKKQAMAMGQYLYCLEVRSRMEDINILDLKLEF